MSVFKSLKGTFQNIQHDIAEGLKSITSSGPLKEGSSRPSKSDSVNLDAGADVLHKYQTIWKELYDDAEQNAQGAVEVDSMIGELYVSCDRQSEVLGRLHEQVSTLPVLLQQLQDITDVLAALDENYDKVESAMVQLENLCDEQDLQRDMADHRQQLTVYKQKKTVEMEKVKVQMAKDYTHKIKKFESTRQTQLKERQETFEEQFEKDIDYFKVHGHPPRQLSSDSGEKADLAEICPDEDQGALDEFLASNEDASATDATPNNTENSTPNVEQQSDESAEKEENLGEQSDDKTVESASNTQPVAESDSTNNEKDSLDSETQKSEAGGDNSNTQPVAESDSTKNEKEGHDSETQKSEAGGDDSK